MTPEELETSYNELNRLAGELGVQASAQGLDVLPRIIAAVGQVVANTGRILADTKKQIADTKVQIDEIAIRERNRDRGTSELRDERAIGFLARLKPEDRERLVGIVEIGPPKISVKEFADYVAEKANMPQWSVNELLQSLSGWYGYLAQRETEEDVNRVASILTGTYRLDQATVTLLEAVDASNSTSPFIQHLKRLLRCHATLGVASKAEMLLERGERRFRYATVSTDLRPIFSGNVRAAPEYGVVLHS